MCLSWFEQPGKPNDLLPNDPWTLTGQAGIDWTDAGPRYMI